MNFTFKTFITFSLFTFLSFSTSAQLISNNGNVIFVDNGQVVYADGGIQNNLNGTFQNSGTIELTGNWTNNGGNSAFLFSLPGTVKLTGGPQQINGNSVTNFFNLNLLGTGIKSLSGIDAIGEGTLYLNDHELATDINTFFVTNTALTSVSRTSGFVSSLGSGALSRQTLSTGNYLFPVGSSAGITRYRPIEISTSSSSANTFGVRLANVDATAEGYDISNKDTILKDLNPYYYHQISHAVGNDPANISFYYDNSMDGNFENVGHWQNAPRWKNTSAAAVNPNSSPSLSRITIAAWSDFSYRPFILALQNDILCGDVFVPNAFSPNDDGMNDLECVMNKCIVSMHFVIYDRWGEKVFETNDPKFCWDGTYRGQLMNDATFMYKLEAVLNNGQQVSKKGNVSLIR